MKTKDLLKQSLTWTETGDAEYPYAALVEQKKLRLRINDFPAEHLYTIVGAGAEVSFDDWPTNWKRSTTAAKKSSTTAVRSIRKQSVVTT
jgi:hypothetical protein